MISVRSRGALGALVAPVFCYSTPKIKYKRALSKPIPKRIQYWNETDYSRARARGNSVNTSRIRASLD